MKHSLWAGYWARGWVLGQRLEKQEMDMLL